MEKDLGMLVEEKVSMSQKCVLAQVGAEEGHKDDHKLAHPLYEDELKELRLLSMEKRRLQENLIAAFWYIKGAYSKDEEGLFIRECSDITRGNSSK